MKNRLFIVFSTCFFLAACGMGRSDRITAHDQTPLASGPLLVNSMIVGEISGGSTYLLNYEGITDGQFKEGLEKSLAAKSLLASNPAQARYRIDAALDFNRHVSWSEGTKIDGSVTYTIHSIADNRQVFNQTLQSDSSVGKNAAVIVLFDTPGQMSQDRMQVYETVAANNLAAFMQTLDTWIPPR